MSSPTISTSPPPPHSSPPPSSSSHGNLPSPHQKWSHSTCSRRVLSIALSNPNITAIEVDIVMGRRIGSRTNECRVPIMAHPPDRESDLTAMDFLEMVTAENRLHDIALDNNNNNNNNNKNDGIDDDNDDYAIRDDGTTTTNTQKKRYLLKNIKLDFKERETIRPTLDYIFDLNIDLNYRRDRVIYLNADVLPGPAMRDRPVAIDGKEFIDLCLSFDPRRRKMRNCNDGGDDDHQQQPSCDNSYHHTGGFAFSLGWRTDPRSSTGYTDDDVDDMIEIITRHDLINRCAGVILAVNARVLIHDCSPFDRFLSQCPSSQLLVFTATGEPPVSPRTIQKIRRHFEGTGMLNKIGFDCKVASSALMGLWYDSLVMLSALYFYSAKRAIDHWNVCKRITE